IERHNLNLRQHLARLGRKSLSFSKSVELHDKVIGHYLGSAWKTNLWSLPFLQHRF
ncbi:IS1 family transposase, partial [Enterobacter cloacae]